MPRKLKLLLLVSALAAPLCAGHAAAHPVRQMPVSRFVVPEYNFNTY